jgi:hypothetical protein
MSRVNGHGPQPDAGIPEGVFKPFAFSVAVLCGQVDALEDARDWPTRWQAAMEIYDHLNCLATDLGAVLRWLALQSPDARRRATGGGSVATGPGERT